jgi:beta-lactamase class A
VELQVVDLSQQTTRLSLGAAAVETLRIHMLNRRAFCCASGALVLGACARPASGLRQPAINRAPLDRLEQRVGGRLGVFAMRAAGGTYLEHRADERFAMCSTFKWALAAAVLARADRGNLRLDEPIAFGEKDLLDYAPITRDRVAEGAMTVVELARAAVVVSDNTAANLLLARIGGPAEVTDFFRELGDVVTRLDRNEPLLNTNLPGDERDTTSPRAMATALQRTVGSEVLTPASRDRLLAWLVASTTGASRLRAGLPQGWKAGDKTGTGSNGACNDVAVLWSPANSVWFVAAYLSECRAPLGEMDAVHAEIGRLLGSLDEAGDA